MHSKNNIRTYMLINLSYVILYLINLNIKPNTCKIVVTITVITTHNYTRNTYTGSNVCAFMLRL